MPVTDGGVRDADKLPWHRSGFQYPREPAKYWHLAHDILQTSPSLEGLYVSSSRAAPFLGVIPLMRSIDPDYCKQIKGMSLEELANRGAAYFARVHIFFLYYSSFFFFFDDLLFLCRQCRIITKFVWRRPLQRLPKNTLSAWRRRSMLPRPRSF